MKCIITIVMTLILSSGYSQDLPNLEIDMSKLADELFSSQSADINYEALYDNLMQVFSNPINLNQASANELEFIRVLTPAQIKNLIQYREENGNLLSIYELQAVPEFDPQSIMRLAPFVKVPDANASIDRSLIKRIRGESDNYFMIRLARELSRDLSAPADISGSPDKMYVRFRSSRAGDFSFGFTGEKDQGEALHWNVGKHYYGIDYWSFHAQLQNKGRLKNLIVGDYQAQFGQGLMIGGIFGTGKGSETITAVRRSNVGFLPYTSSYESGNLNGIAGTYQLTPTITISSFYSHCLRDGATSDTTDYITNLQATGLHRTKRELENRKQISNNNWGIVAAFSKKGLEGGLMFNHFDFGRAIDPVLSVYNQFSFRGRANNNIGFFLNLNARNVSFFSEAARTLNGETSLLIGSLFSLSPSFDLSIIYRNYQNRFYTMYTNAFGENSLPQNERGLYWGWKYKLNRRFSIGGYVDFFESPWLKYRAYKPSSGYEYLFKVTYQPSKNVAIFIQGREESKERNTGDPAAFYDVQRYQKFTYCLQTEAGIRDKLRLKTRLQMSTFSISNHTSYGFALAQDIRTDLGKFQITGRYALFDTDDYDTRQYMYENDVLLAFSMPAYFGLGVRKMIMMRYKINRHLSIWIRYASTRYHEQEKIEMSDNNIVQSIKNDLKFQFQIQF
ncbi:MAG: helix-hairpin-helix domain-containing protein [Chryseolinea sp.]